MLKSKQGEFGLVPLLVLLFGAVVFVSAQVLNSSVNITLNGTVPNISLNESVIFNQSIKNLSLTNESAAINGTVTIENSTLNQSINLTINLTLPKKLKNLSEIVEKNKNKLNNQTEKYLKEIKDKKEERKYIIKFRNFIDENRLANATLEKRIGRFKVTKIKGKAEDIESLIEDNEIEFLELEQNVKILEDNIPFNIKKVKVDSVWNLSKGSGVKIAVLDTGISLHNDLSIAGGVSFVDNNYFDSNGHGTSVAGVIAASLNNEGLAGAAPDVSLYSVKIMQGSTGDLSNAIAGIEWAINNSMDIASMSFGFDSYSQIFKEVLQEAYNDNILLIAASGNEGTDNILYPAKYSTVIVVGATTSDDSLAYFSSYGFEQELVAPGVDINSTSLGNSYSLSSGTSMAAPHVSGVAALIKSYNNSLTNEQIRAKLRNDALDLGQAGKDDLFGYGLVQVNLNANNFTFINLSYFYEIFNIGNFRQLNQSYQFWINGTGTIDDVDFLPGYYLVNITFGDGSYKSRIYNVSENGSFWVLSTTLTHTDNFQTESGTTHDNIAWVNDGITVKTSSDVNTPEGECYKIDGVSTFNYCFFDTSGHQTECDSSPDITCGGSTTCSVGNLLEIERSILNDASARSGSSKATIIPDCTFPGSSLSSSDTVSYYVADKKRIRCTNTSGYVYEGYYGSENWISYGSGLCNSGSQTLCQDSANFTTETATMPNPCVNPNTCTGTVQVITEDRNGNAMSNLLVSRDEVSNKTTNSVGVAEYNLSKTCNQDMEFKVYCSNSSGAQLCGTKTARLEYVNDYEGLLFDCSICSGTPDMQTAVNDVKFNKAANNVTVNISLVSSFTATNINITFKIQNKDGLIARENSQLFDISSGSSFKFVNQTISLTENDEFLHVYVDTNNRVSESNEKNNYALVPLFKPQITAYLSINTGYTSIDNKIKDFLKLYVIEESAQSKANVTIAVGLPKKNSIIESKNWLTQKNYQWFFTHSVYYNNKLLGSKPYNGIVGAFRDDYNYIFVGGNDIDGLLVAVKRLISARSLFFSNLDKHKVKVIEDTDVAGIAVADLLRNPSNKPYYNQRGSDAFANVVSRILNNNNFEISIKTVKTYNDNTTLRLKNINTDYSQNFKDAIIGNNKSVVLARGLWSNLLSWESFGRELAFDKDNARDTWLIEITGGDTTECENCANYNYNDLVDYYWPALITGVQNYSGQKTLDYVGFSNGCRVALSSLSNYSRSGKNNSGYIFDSQIGNYITSDLGSNPVSIFIGVGCPGAFIGQSFFKEFFGNHGTAINKSLSNKNHITVRDVAEKLTIECSKEILSDDKKQCQYIAGKLSESDEGYKISRNLANDYLGFIKDNNDGQPVYNNLNISKSYFIYSILTEIADKFKIPGNLVDFDQDGVVTSNDSIKISSLIISNNTDKTKQFTNIGHSDLTSDNSIKKFIRGVIR